MGLPLWLRPEPGEGPASCLTPQTGLFCCPPRGRKWGEHVGKADVRCHACAGVWEAAGARV